FFLHDLLAVQTKSHEHLIAQRTDEQVAFPAREPSARVERHSRWCYRRNPVVDRLRHAGLGRSLADLRADSVFDAVRKYRSVIVGSGPNELDCIPALRPVLVSPQRARLRMQCCALLVSIAKRVLLGLPAR